MDHDFGYVYVLTNPSMPGQVKVGMTRRRPERRGAELSSATGVPQQFELFYARSFEDCALAEKVVHSVLDEQGARTAKNREFFNLTPEQAKELIDKVAERLAVPETADVFAEAFTARAQQHLTLPRPSVAELEEALTLLEHAASLGHHLAPYLAGETAVALSERKKGPAGVAERLVARGRELFQLSAERGVSRGFGRAAEASLRLGETFEYATLWGRYLAALPPDEPIPEEELEFILVFVHDHMFSGEKACPPVHGYLQANYRQLRAGARGGGASKEFLVWLDEYASTLSSRLVTKAKWPLVGLAGLAAFWAIRPEAFVLFLAAALLLAGVGAGIRRRYRTRAALKAPKTGRIDVSGRR
ncbi:MULTISPECIES: GIY-YIG nuclease family protein [unclassified Variovorax]|uniref:GIY-YIG nuclease family protein n=1 Tax=unclassified Variovorax TaxID=663243 RepID=UPI001317704B|nr:MULTISPECIES: GIY-YIG nuclease family protein [unclassified Variovorax]VTU42239.1 T5orf172 domain protein [Variovorax sp. PBL-H6]VTU44142.1 T5orf172 domain protein [Variovorax sp. SRS16]VTU44223.1 T5orf172 domain protein [Variovorax sp. PBL-E5]